MRLIGTFDTEKQAYTFYSFLLKEGVQNIYESYTDLNRKKKDTTYGFSMKKIFKAQTIGWNIIESIPKSPVSRDASVVMAQCSRPAAIFRDCKRRR